MLTSEHAIVKFEGAKALPDRLTRKHDAQYVELATAMLLIYQKGVGHRRRELHQQLGRLFDDIPCNAKRIASFCKLLDDKSEYHTDSSKKASRIRLKVFRQAATQHPLVKQKQSRTLFGSLENEEAVVKKEIADAMGLTWQEVDEVLYADVISFHRLKTPPDYEDSTALLRHYNLAQTQAALFKAESATLTVDDDFKTILRHIKLSELMYEVSRMDDSNYRFQLNGPASVIRNTRRYGIRYAKLLPALVRCENWSFSAKLKTPWNTLARLDLSPNSGLVSHLDAPPEFDSSVEEKFAQKFGEEREGWRLVREGVILHKHQKTFIPDFVFRHHNGKEVLFEIIGFWTPEYLEDKLETLNRFSEHKIHLAVCENIGGVEAFEKWDDQLILYKTAITLESVMKKLAQEKAQ